MPSANPDRLAQLAEAPAYALPPNAARRLAGYLYLTHYRLFSRAALKRAQHAVELTLPEPETGASEIARSCFVAKGQQRSNYRSMARRPYWPAARATLPPRFRCLLADERTPLVLLTIHQADYLAGLLAVLQQIPNQREIHIIKLAAWTPLEEQAYAHFRQYGHTLTIHRLADRPAKRIVRALKRGAILLTFVDVPQEFGSTERVTLFGLPFRLTSGPLALARLARATTVPLFTHYAADGVPELQVGTSIPSCRVLSYPAQPIDLPALTQQLADQLEANLRRHAPQWEMWPVIENLLDREALAAGLDSVTAPALPRLARYLRATRSANLSSNPDTIV